MMNIEPVAVEVLRLVQRCECEDFFPEIGVWPGTSGPNMVCRCYWCKSVWALVEKGEAAHPSKQAQEG